jgi:hypothetical protein
MRTALLLAAAMLIATPSFAQEKTPPESFSPPSQSGSRTQGNYRFHARLFDTCCLSSGSAQATYDSGSTSAPDQVAQSHGGPDWQPTNFVAFPQAVADGEQTATLTPGQQPTHAMVQQMLDLIQQDRAVKNQNQLQGQSGAVKWSDLKPQLNPADYRRPPSTYMSYAKALALGQQEEAQEEAPAPSLGDVARDEQESKPADQKPKVVIKQDAQGNPVIVHKP